MIKRMVVIMLLASPLFACPPGFVPTENPKVCVEQPTQADHPEWVSDEKPPTDKMPSYQREGIAVVTAPPGVEPDTTTAHDYAAEREQK